MCFSAEASFVAGAGLVLCGGLTLHRAARADRRLLPLGCLPLFFGIQQLSEGALWLALDSGPPAGTTAPMLVFLFFAYWFWPAWVPFSAAVLEPDPARKRLFRACAVAGLVLGGALYLPVLLSPGALQITIVHHSIRYDNPQMFPSEALKLAARALYAAIICGPLLASSHRRVQVFGVLVLASVIFGFAVLSYAFTSVWCFIAAILSAYILWVPQRPDTATARG